MRQIRIPQQNTESQFELFRSDQSTSEDISPGEIERFTRTLAEQIAKASHHSLTEALGKHVLWVDDRPQNNVHERRSLEVLGVRFKLATSTEEALEQVSHAKFDAIISDMGRPPDRRAGYTLLDALRSQGDKTPFLIYAGSRAPNHIAEFKERGAKGTTNRPDELFEMVLRAVGLD